MNGYIIIDCNGLDLAKSTEQTIAGIFSRVKEAYSTGKPCIAYNCVKGNYKVSPVSIMITQGSTGNYIATANTFQIELDSEDGATVTNVSQSN